MPAHEQMLGLAAARGYDLTGHRAVQVGPDLLERAIVILAMDRAVLTELRGQMDADVPPGSPSTSATGTCLIRMEVTRSRSPRVPTSSKQQLGSTLHEAARSRSPMPG